MTRLKDIAVLNRAALPEHTDPDRLFRYVDIGAVDNVGEIKDAEELRFADAPSRARRLVQPGDSILSTVRTYLRAIAHIGDDAPDLVVSTGFATVTPRTGVHSRFLFWALRSNAFIEDVVARSVGVSYPAITATALAAIPVTLPAIAAQKRIAAHLDAETRDLDCLIAELAGCIALVQEESQRRQTDLALRGARRQDLRPSGHNWMGDVPAHWRVSRLKFEARLESGHTPSRSRPELWLDCTIPWVSLNDVGALASVEFIEETVNLISEAGLAASSARMLPEGTVVVSRDATIGRCGILGRPMATSQHFAAWVCGESLLPRYLWLVFRTAMQAHFESLTDGATLRTIGMPDMRNLVVPIPPLDEQHDIVRVAECSRRLEHEVVEELNLQTTLLRERRQALVTAAVIEGLETRQGVA